MADHGNPKLDQVYAAKTTGERQQAYDAWANEYDRDIMAFGMRLPFVASAVFARFVGREAKRILDAGCGTGMQSEALALMGYGPLTGIDLSPSMMEAARAKDIYATLMQAVLGERLDFDDNAFEVSYCIGALTPGHAPAETFDELIRVTESGGYVIFSLRVDEGTEQQAYLDAVARHNDEQSWRERFSTPPFSSMPYADPAILHAVYVYEVL